MESHEERIERRYLRTSEPRGLGWNLMKRELKVSSWSRGRRGTWPWESHEERIESLHGVVSLHQSLLTTNLMKRELKGLEHVINPSAFSLESHEERIERTLMSQESFLP